MRNIKKLATYKNMNNLKLKRRSIKTDPPPLYLLLIKLVCLNLKRLWKPTTSKPTPSL